MDVAQGHEVRERRRTAVFPMHDVVHLARTEHDRAIRVCARAVHGADQAPLCPRGDPVGAAGLDDTPVGVGDRDRDLPDGTGVDRRLDRERDPVDRLAHGGGVVAAAAGSFIDDDERLGDDPCRAADEIDDRLQANLAFAQTGGGAGGLVELMHPLVDRVAHERGPARGRARCRTCTCRSRDRCASTPGCRHVADRAAPCHSPPGCDRSRAPADRRTARVCTPSQWR